MYPILEDEEISTCLMQMKSKTVSFKNLYQNPYIFEKFVEYFTGKNIDTIAIPKLSGLDCFLYPELHENSVTIIMTHRVLQKIFFSAGIKSFSLSDYLGNNHERFRTITSGVLNLAKFKEEAIKVFKKIFKKIQSIFSSKKKNRNFLVKLLSEIKWYIKKKYIDLIEINNIKKETFLRLNSFYLWAKQLNFSFQYLHFKIKEKFLQTINIFEEKKVLFFEKMHNFYVLKKATRSKFFQISFNFKTLKVFFLQSIQIYGIFVNFRNFFLDFIINSKKVFFLITLYYEKFKKKLFYIGMLETFFFHRTKRFCENRYNLFMTYKEYPHLDVKRILKKNVQQKLKKFCFLINIFRKLYNVSYFAI